MQGRRQPAADTQAGRQAECESVSSAAPSMVCSCGFLLTDCAVPCPLLFCLLQKKQSNIQDRMGLLQVSSGGRDC
jgi:hypothetical protein